MPAATEGAQSTGSALLSAVHQRRGTALACARPDLRRRANYVLQPDADNLPAVVPKPTDGRSRSARFTASINASPTRLNSAVSRSNAAMRSGRSAIGTGSFAYHCSAVRLIPLGG
jgi:hypothetical protein